MERRNYDEGKGEKEIIQDIVSDHDSFENVNVPSVDIIPTKRKCRCREIWEETECNCISYTVTPVALSSERKGFLVAKIEDEHLELKE